MPNWCSNNLVVEGPQADNVRSLAAKLGGEE